MNYKTLNRIYGAVIFLITTIVYLSTVQPNVSFWDCGEFIASSYLLQVPHPPGTPFFLLVGRLFSMIPFSDNVAYSVNMISVLSSALTVLFLYLSAVRLIEFFKKDTYKSTFEAVATFTAAGIGALSLAFSDTFWFNATEAEVYANATFFIAIVVWLILTWYAKADEADNEKYILMIAYLIGLSTGVHLMSVLAIPTLVMIIMFRKYVTDEALLKHTGILFIVHSAIILVIAIGMWASQSDSVPPSVEIYKAFDQKIVLIVAVVTVIFMGIFWRKLFNKNSFYMPMIIGGIALVGVYPGMVKHLPNLITKIGQNNLTLDITLFVLVFAIIGYAIYWSNKNDKLTLNMIFKSALFALVGFTTYSMIIIRSNQDTPINLNSPKTFPELISYLNREQYGDFPTFKRRYSQEPHQQAIYTSYSSDLDFFWRYQMNHMFNRYLLWNYAGRVSTEQDQGVDWSKLFGIPFFLALFGVYYHFRKDWKMASAFLILFIFLGWLTAFYQNQQQPQPRERDYFYVGAFFVFSIWIALGTRGILDFVIEQFKESKVSKYASYGVLTFGILLVPVNMLFTNYFEHDRSRNYVPWDYSYNLLQSVATNAIVFTNGDNDTFPLWYLQDVEGVRRDVRIANLSLLNTPWYIDQLKNTEPHGAAKIKMTLTDEEIQNIGPQRWEPQNLSMPVNKEVYEQFGLTDTAIVNKGSIDWFMNNTLQYGEVKAIRAQDIAVLSIILANQFERPIYFLVTVAEESRIGLDNYLVMEGMAYRLMPYKHPGDIEYVNEEIMRIDLFEEPEGYSKEYQPGFKFRGLDDPTIFFDDNHERLVQNYRNSYMRLALHYLYNEKNNEMVVKTLDKMEEKIPRNIIPIDSRLLHDIGNIYHSVGAFEKAVEIGKEVEQYALRRLEQNPQDFGGRYSPYIMLLEIYENSKEYSKAIDILRRLQQFAPDDPSIKARISELQKLDTTRSTELPQEIPIDTSSD